MLRLENTAFNLFNAVRKLQPHGPQCCPLLVQPVAAALGQFSCCSRVRLYGRNSRN